MLACNPRCATRRPSIVYAPRIVAFLLFAMCTALWRVSVAVDGLDREVTFDIAPQPLDHALLEFSKQSGIQIMVASRSVGNAVTQGVKGTHRASEALTLLLKDSGLSFSVNNDTVTVAPHS